MLIRVLVVTLEGLEVPFPAAADCELLVSCRLVEGESGFCCSPLFTGVVMYECHQLRIFVEV